LDKEGLLKKSDLFCFVSSDTWHRIENDHLTSGSKIKGKGSKDSRLKDAYSCCFREKKNLIWLTLNFKTTLS
jgi:hypothetical protein